MTFLVVAYNEAGRIRQVLDHASKWAKEIVIVDKGSTDGTQEIIRSYGGVRLVPIPYSERGCEDVTLLPQYTTADWIFCGTCSEIPTRKLIEQCEEVLAARGDELDLIYVPRLMYFFGLHRLPDNGGVSHYPFLIHRERTIITNAIHDNFHPRDPARTFRIPYADDCCVHHFTHPTARSFWLSSLGYFATETRKDRVADKAIRECFKNIDKLSQRLLAEGDNWLPFYCAQASYELGKALHLWEHARGEGQAPLIYRQLADQLLAHEWKAAPLSGQPPASAARGPVVDDLKPLAAGLGRSPYLVIKWIMALQRIFPRRSTKRESRKDSSA